MGDDFNNEQKFAKGNKRGRGRPPGSLNRTTQLAAKLLADNAEGLVRKAIEKALDGDATCLKLCFERLLPARRAAPVRIKLPMIQTADDLVAAFKMIVAALESGDISPSEAAELSKVIESAARTLDVAEHGAEIHALVRNAA